ncbi:MAG: MFS transporter [Thermoplasmataceae archaeon]
MPDKPYSRNFKLLIAGGYVDNISLYMMLVLFPWLVLSITNSPFLTGLELAMSDLPLSLSFLVGYYLTRVKRKKQLFLLSTAFRALILLFIFVVFLTGDHLYDIVALLIGYFLTSWTEDVGEQIGGYWIKEFLDEDQYQRGFSLYGFLNMIITLISYILAGSFIAIGTVYSFPVLILGFTISTVIHSFIKPKTESEGASEDDRHSFREGISYIWKNKALRYLMIQALLISLAFGGNIMVTEVLVKFRYNGSPLILTLLLVGAMIGGVVGNKYADKIKGNPRNIMGLLTLTYVPIVLFIPFSPSYIYIIPDFFLLMFTSQIVGVIFHTVFYKATPKDYMLQISGAHKTLALFPSVLSGLILGAVIQFISLDWAFYLMAIISAAILLVIWKAREIGDFKLQE